MTPAFAARLDLIIQKTYVKAQKIDGLALKIYGIATTRFFV